MSETQHNTPTATNQRHPDIEVYIKNRSAEQVLEWLHRHCDNIETLSSTDNSLELELRFGEQYINSSIQQKVSGKAWSSLWFKSNATPWNTDLECAELASHEMQTQTRCIKGGWSDEQSDTEDEDQWWKIEDNEKESISWKG